MPEIATKYSIQSTISPDAPLWGIQRKSWQRGNIYNLATIEVVFCTHLCTIDHGF